MFGDVLGVLLMFWWCFCGVLAVFWRCSRGVLVVLQGLASKKRATLLLGLYAGLIFEFLKQIPRNMLDKIACETCVTLRIEGSELCLLGFKTAIEDALAEIKRVISSPDLIPSDMAEPPNNAREVYHLAPLIRFCPKCARSKQ